MPYVQRNEEGKITAVYDKPTALASELVPPNSPGVIEFLYGDETPPEGALEGGYFEELNRLRKSDLEFVRVLEDLIYLLLEKNLINITEFPVQAIKRLQQRESIRNKLSQMGSVLFSTDERIE